MLLILLLTAIVMAVIAVITIVSAAAAIDRRTRPRPCQAARPAARPPSPHEPLPPPPPMHSRHLREAASTFICLLLNATPTRWQFEQGSSAMFSFGGSMPPLGLAEGSCMPTSLARISATSSR